MEHTSPTSTWADRTTPRGVSCGSLNPDSAIQGAWPVGSGARKGEVSGCSTHSALPKSTGVSTRRRHAPKAMPTSTRTSWLGSQPITGSLSQRGLAHGQTGATTTAASSSSWRSGRSPDIDEEKLPTSLAAKGSFSERYSSAARRNLEPSGVRATTQPAHLHERRSAPMVARNTAAAPSTPSSAWRVVIISRSFGDNRAITRGVS